MSQHPLVQAIPRKNHPVGSRGLSVILAAVGQNRELVVWPGIGKGEALVVVELVRVAVAADSGAGLEVAAAGGDGCVDVGLGIAGVAAAFGALAGNEEGGGEGGGGKCKGERGLGRVLVRDAKLVGSEQAGVTLREIILDV